MHRHYNNPVKLKFGTIEDRIHERFIHRNNGVDKKYGFGRGAQGKSRIAGQIKGGQLSQLKPSHCI